MDGFRNSSVFYIMPGGGQHAGELLPEAARREVAEELGIDIRPQSLAFIIEGAHDEDFHRVDFIFLCEYIGEISGAVLQGDTNQIGYAWLDIDTLNKQSLFPSKLRRAIMRLHESGRTDVYLGNEGIGDPECLD
ncbi:NUDIX domain-containing protein [Paenibacillus sp. GCM10012307]|uniref:NUDIX domain-containing protein n=1 Tax=Paenibacillus roseus TaxID=2798579 RepID=A0A934J5D5_9BACL|nr:NUDIX domain-containing protein [Paenibacillus roseus]MBJ6360725.1 NUDIX domain-containing protein [Paenibacillus roseus]